MARVYISGPMRGYPNMNRAAFESAKQMFEARGHAVVSPVDVGDRLDKGGAVKGLGGTDYLAADILAILGSAEPYKSGLLPPCDSMCLLAGWEKSVGARCEATIAVSLGFTFYDESGNRVPAPQEILIRGGYERPVELPPEVARLSA